ncbi:hypothetical protein J2736_003801 [Paenibacillus qinlingensis]|uniref:Uncharacterized protein n=1 Tax=Paenibacillus qinlingensis TaxID=1837343 RepID=A0ABU1NYL9_9BACL|nr:hypothetical protein [Paenibacillus qinlingensis]
MGKKKKGVRLQLLSRYLSSDSIDVLTCPDLRQYKSLRSYDLDKQKNKHIGSLHPKKVDSGVFIHHEERVRKFTRLHVDHILMKLLHLLNPANRHLCRAYFASAVSIQILPV